MPPKTRASLKKSLAESQDQAAEEKPKASKTKNSRAKKSNGRGPLPNPEILCKTESEIPLCKSSEEKKDEGGSDIDSISSSSAEDSDDDWKKKKRRAWNKSDSELSSDDDRDDNIIKDIEKKIERETKKKRIRRKEKKILEGTVSDDDDVNCVFESKDVAKLRKRRIYRRETMNHNDKEKRRRIRRPDIDMADEFTCDSLVEIGSNVENLTTELSWDDPDLDVKAAKRLFRDLGLDDEDYGEISSGEDEADIVSNNFSQYHSRNSKERVSQVIELDVAPFSEKLTCYNSIKAIHGSSRSCIQNHHPDFLVKKDMRFPEELLWNQPFESVLYLPIQFDPHEKCNKFLNKISEEKKNEAEAKLLEELKQKIEEKVEVDALNNSFGSEKFKETDEFAPVDYNLNNFYSALNNFENNTLKVEEEEFSSDGF